MEPRDLCRRSLPSKSNFAIDNYVCPLVYITQDIQKASLPTNKLGNDEYFKALKDINLIRSTTNSHKSQFCFENPQKELDIPSKMTYDQWLERKSEELRMNKKIEKEFQKYEEIKQKEAEEERNNKLIMSEKKFKQWKKNKALEILSTENLRAQTKSVQENMIKSKQQIAKEKYQEWLRSSLKTLKQTKLSQIKEKAKFEQEKQQKRIHQEIDDKKDDYIQRLEEKEKIKAETELKKQQELTKKEQDRAMRAQKAKNTATVYKTTKNSMGEMERKRLQQEAMQKQKKLQEDIRRNKNKVSERQAIQEQKILERIEDNELQQRAKEEEELRIAKAVSQYPHIPKVEVDHERVKQATKSNEAKKNQFDKSDKVNLFPQTGFTVDNLMKDMRYRLSHVLNEAGLQNTEYGKRVLQAAPHILPRKDTVTTHNFK